MNRDELLKEWLDEQKIAHMKGWDFSHIRGRYREEDDLPWDFREVVRKYLREDNRLLDMETGGGEFLLTFHHDPELTTAIEGFEPNIKLCEEKLLPLGITFQPADGGGPLPFEDGSFDVITNRHGDYDIRETKRVLKQGGLFLTQQVGADNDAELMELLMGKAEMTYPEAYLEKAKAVFESNGFDLLESGEVYRPIEFYDVGALVWYARIIEWEFPGFSVEEYKENLFKAQQILEAEGKICGSIHRYYLVARKQ